MRYPDLRIDSFQVALLCFLPDLFPVLLRVPFDRLSPELPRTIEASILLIAVCRCSIIHLDRFEVGFTTVLLQCSDRLRLLEIEIELNMRGPILPFLQLSCYIACSANRMPFFQIINYKLNGWVVESTDIRPSDSLTFLLHIKYYIINITNITPLL